MAAPARSEPYRSGVLIAGKYRLTERLGVGAMGTVWSAVNVDTHGRVALKLIERPEPELRHRLLREARACAAIHHRNVVQVFDVGQTDSGDPFLIMELLRGDTLAALLQRRRSLPEPEAVVLARDIARGLAAAHEQGIVHRDLKPANVFLQERPGEDAPVVKLLDFGVSKCLTTSDGLHTVVGGTIGSPVYMSPEQARGEPDVDLRADIWSFGVVLYEMLTGERPFSGESTDILFKITHAAIPRVSHRLRRVAPGLDELVAACLTRDRAQRPASAAEIAAQLEGRMASSGQAHRAPLPSSDEEEEAPTVLLESGGAPVVPVVGGPGPAWTEPSNAAAHEAPTADLGGDPGGATALAFAPESAGMPAADRSLPPAPVEPRASAPVIETPGAVLPAGAARRRRFSPLVMVLVPVWVVLLGAIVLVSTLRPSRAREGAPAPATGPDAGVPLDPGPPPAVNEAPDGGAPPAVHEAPLPGATAPGNEAAPSSATASGNESVPPSPTVSGDKTAPPSATAPAGKVAPGNKTARAGASAPAKKASPAQPRPCPSKFGFGCAR